MSIRQKRNRANRNEIQIAPEDRIQKLSEMKPEERPTPPAVPLVVSGLKRIDTQVYKTAPAPAPAKTIRAMFPDDEEFLDDPDEDDFLDGPDEDDFLDDPDDDPEEEDFLDEEDPEEEETEAPLTVPMRKDSREELKENGSDDDDPDKDDLDEDDPDDDEIEALLAQKEAFKAARREKRALRKQRVKDFFTNRKKVSLKEVFQKKPDIKGFFHRTVDKLASIGVEKGENEEGLDLNTRMQIVQNKNRIRIVAIGTALVLLITGYGIYREVRVFHHFKVLNQQERQDDNATEYVELKGLRLKCNPNGVTCVNRKNEVVWNTTFTMQSPIVDKCGDLVAVGAQRGNEIYIFNEDGLLSSFSVDHVLTKMKITKQGDVAVILEDGQVTWINVYNKWGTLLIRDKTTMSGSGYPIDMDISANGYKMMVSFLGVKDDIESRVSFYNFSAVGQDSEGKLVNEEYFQGNVVPEVKFMEGNYAIAFLDDGVAIFRGQQIPEECSRISVTQEIISEFSNEKYFGLVTESDEEDSEHKFKMVIYRENGSRCGKVYFNYEYTNIVMNENQVILYNSSSMRIYSVTGKLQFSGNYEKPILKVIPTSSSRKFRILTEDSLDLIKIK